MMSASFMGLLVSFLSTNNAFSLASILIGTNIDFVNELYIPLGKLSNSLQEIITGYTEAFGVTLK